MASIRTEFNALTSHGDRLAKNGQALTPRFGGDNAGLGGVVLSGRSKVTQLKMQNMAEKVEMFAGWDWDSSVIVGREMNQHLPNRCTVVVHDDKAERVFTESEVKAILCDLLAAAEDGPFMPNYDRMDEMVRLHGLSFDPA